MTSPIDHAKAATPFWMMEIQKFDALEIHPVHEIGEEEGTDGKRIIYCEPCEPHEAHFWSVYGRLKEGGVDCFEDLPTQAEAEAFAARLRSTYPHLT